MILEIGVKNSCAATVSLPALKYPTKVMFYPPRDASDFEKVPMKISTSFSSP